MTEDEEYARSELYGLLSMLFYGPPSQVVLDLITDAAIEGEGALASGWRSLQRASGKTDQDRVRAEYEALFAGTGPAAVALCGSHYLSATALASLHNDLARLGLERSEHLKEGEDHFAALCDAMRSLHGNLPAQREFFGAHIQPWLVATALAVCGGWLVYEARTGGFRLLETPDDETPANWRCMAWVSAGLLLNALLITQVGFVLSCALLFTLAARGLRLSMGQVVTPARMLLDAAVGVVISAPTYWLFTKGLGLTLPGLTGTGWI